ncbi:hypothetical protein [Halobaculum lipolyticum]|uniref:DUF8101 domain-containing protein n=1 Tax=Halobaculum lipolyticum TaxID=3032001 RepID=A0ABD5WBL6_9EURY|nr:hypothetical protein [Halobaculum sp. DT31]
MDDEHEDGDATEPSSDPGPDGTDDATLPTDGEASLARLVESARTALREGRTDDALAAVERADAVAADELPEGDRRDRIRHGCARVADLAADDPPVASEYLDAIRRRLP